MERTSLFIFLSMALFGMCSCKLHKVNLAFEEDGKKFDQKFFVDENNRFEFIKVPQHGNRVAVTVLIDTELHYAVHKMPAMKMCYVIKTDGHEEKPMDEENSIKEVNNTFPYDKYSIRNHRILVEGDADTTSEIGKIAAKFCRGGYQIKNAVSFKGDEDVSEYVNKQMQASVQSSDDNRDVTGSHRSKRDVVLRDFVMFSCSQEDSEHAINELTRCGGVLNDFRATCQFRRSSCTYRVHCDFDENIGSHVCKGNHDLNSIICCTYQCNL